MCRAVTLVAGLVYVLCKAYFRQQHNAQRRFILCLICRMSRCKLQAESVPVRLRSAHKLITYKRVQQTLKF